MRFEERIIPPLVRLAHKLLDKGYFGFIEPIGNLLVAFQSGRWRQLPDDEQIYWLEKSAGIFGMRALGDSWDLQDADLSQINSLIVYELKALRRG